MGQKKPGRVVGKRNFVKTAVVAWVALLVGLALTPSRALSQDVIAFPVETKAPGFTLKDLTGTEVSLKDFHGQPVLIAFWQTT